MTILQEQPGPNPSRRRRRIGEVLVEQGLITEDTLQQLLAKQSAQPSGTGRKRLGRLVVDSGVATESQVAEALAEALGLELVDLGRTIVVPEHVRLLPRQVAERSGVLILDKIGNRIRVATADPTNVVALDDVKLYTGAAEVDLVVATDSQVRDHLSRCWSLSEDSSDMNTLFEGLGEDETVESEAQQSVEAAPIVRLVDVVLADAVRARASDVHVEPQAGDLRIRYRVDGLLRDVMTVPKNATSAAVSRIKIVSGLDIAERRRPQDGRAKLTVDGLTVEARVSTLPTLHGEKVVIRLLPRAENVPLLSKTGMTPDQLEKVSSAFTQSQGLVLITGPTGSGKTNTLYAAIQQVSTPDRNIVTLEDPVEVQVAGITQVQVNVKQGMTFAKGLRSILRQDPDIVLVGEVRDQETAELALQASLTGHLVLTTLHTNDAVAAITRLVDMGVEPFLVASSLSLVVAQRLVRTPCQSCKAPYTPDARTLALLGLAEIDLAGATPTRGRGCADCVGSGYRGRTGVYEVLPITASLRQVLLSSPTEAAIGAAARENGMSTLRASALAAAHRGETTYEEVLRATHVDTSEGPTCPTCARALADGMLVCPWDGAAVTHDLCVGCGKQLDAAWSTCPWCRTQVLAAQPTPVAPPLPISLPAPIAVLEPIAPPRWLHVHADPARRATLTAALGTRLHVTVATTAEQALVRVGKENFAGVLLDQDLPDLSGLDLLRLLREKPQTSPLRVVLLTDQDSAALRAQALASGADDVLRPETEPTDLCGRLLALSALPG